MDAVDDRGRIVTGMCFTARHDYGLINPDDDSHFSFSLSGMNNQQRMALYNQMDQLYDHHIKPLVEVLKELRDETEDVELKEKINRSLKECGCG